MAERHNLQTPGGGKKERFAPLGVIEGASVPTGSLRLNNLTMKPLHLPMACDVYNAQPQFTLDVHVMDLYD